MAFAPIVARAPKEWLPYLVIDGWNKAVPLYSVVIAVPLFIIPRLMVSRAWSRELDWARALPFELHSYAWRLGEYPRSRYESRHELVIEFVGPPPEPQALTERLAERGATWTVEIEGPRALIERVPGLAVRGSSSNRNLVQWLHRFVARQLLPLHADQPIRRIELK
jgi:hypothetical protein